jgi:hypothetical protein
MSEFNSCFNIILEIELDFFYILSFLLDVVLDAHARVPASGLLIIAKMRWFAL